MADNNPVSQNSIPPKAVPPAPAEGAAPSDAIGGGKRKTSRIPMPSSTTAIPVGSEVPPTIAVRPLSGSTASESVPAQAAKSKTSRIPLEAAMGIPQTGEGAGVPRTIKLKRPGDMSMSAGNKVSVPGAGSGSVMAEQDAGAIAQRKTIRVKRPTESELAAASAADTMAEAPVSTLPPALFQHAQERDSGSFVAVAVICILVTLGVILVFWSQAFGSNASLTQLAAPGISIPMPGKIPVEG